MSVVVQLEVLISVEVHNLEYRVPYIQVQVLYNCVSTGQDTPLSGTLDISFVHKVPMVVDSQSYQEMYLVWVYQKASALP
jgi:hypothetical protein